MRHQKIHCNEPNLASDRTESGSHKYVLSEELLERV